MSDVEEVAGQDTLPGRWPEPIVTADMFIANSITDSLSQFQYFLLSNRGYWEGDEAARERSILKSNMHLFAFMLDAVIVELLGEIQGYSRTWADRIASELEDKFESDYFYESLWHWAEERGLDPESIIDKAKAKFAEKEAS